MYLNNGIGIEYRQTFSLTYVDVWNFFNRNDVTNFIAVVGLAVTVGFML